MTKKIPGAPKWLYKKPDDKKKKLVSDKVNNYIKKLATEG